ncbi:MAG: carotenoid oxygenase family protein [Hyphomonadaceae bacterium]
MNLSRRLFLHSGLAAGTALAVAPKALAEPTLPGWHVGYANAPADGFPQAAMTLVKGKAPAGLSGALYRNGPAWFRHGDQYATHWFDGDGMVQRIAIGDGKAVHSGRFVDTQKRRLEMAAGKFLAPGFGTVGDPSYPVGSSDDVNPGNISVMMSGGELLALWEAGSPYRLDPVTLETKGLKSWRNDLKGMPFLAHPKREPDGRVWSLAMNGKRVGIYNVAPDGSLAGFGLVDIGAAHYIHDWTMTARKLVILCQPWVQTKNTPPFIDGFVWKPEEGMKYLIIDKDDLTKTRWAQGPARSFYHTGAAWEESDGTIRLDAAFYPRPILGSGGGAEEIRGKYSGDAVSSKLTMAVIPASGDAKMVETNIAGDFPQVDPRRHGLARTLTTMITGSVEGQPGGSALAVQDWSTGKAQVHDFGSHYMVEEFLFVPKPGGSSEADSWLIGTAINTKLQRTEVHVFDAGHVADGPVAVWQADYAWPLGFHGTWAGA